MDGRILHSIRTQVVRSKYTEVLSALARAVKPPLAVVRDGSVRIIRVGWVYLNIQGVFLVTVLITLGIYRGAFDREVIGLNKARGVCSPRRVRNLLRRAELAGYTKCLSSCATYQPKIKREHTRYSLVGASRRRLLGGAADCWGKGAAASEAPTKPAKTAAKARTTTMRFTC